MVVLVVIGIWAVNRISRRSARAGAQYRDGFDLDLHFGQRERADLDQCGDREIAGEELAARTPHFLALVDVGDENVDLDDVGHGAAGGLDQVFDLGEDDARLPIRAPSYLPFSSGPDCPFPVS